MITENKRRSTIALAIALILLAPFVAMQFKNEVTWMPADFAVAAILLLGTGVACELVIRKVVRTRYRLAICLAIFMVFLLVWLELAVGILWTPLAGR